MKYETTIRKLEKLGFSVRRDIRDSKMNPGTQYEAGFFARLPNGKRTIEASKQDDVVISMRVIRDGDKDDSQSDYFAGTWVYTVKRAIELASLER